jgi:hypothetical protein
VAEQMTAQMAAYEAQIRVLEGFRLVTSELEVTNFMALHDLGSPSRIFVRSSVDSRSDHNILFLFLI